MLLEDLGGEVQEVIQGPLVGNIHNLDMRAQVCTQMLDLETATHAANTTGTV